MKIKHKLVLSANVVILLIASLVSFLFMASRRINYETEKYRLYEKLQSDLSDLNIVLNEYALYHEQRMIDQWKAKYRTTAERLAQLSVDPGQEPNLRAIQSDFRAMGTLFESIATTDGSSGLTAEKGVLTELLIKSQRVGVRLGALVEHVESGLHKSGFFGIKWLSIVCFIVLIIALTVVGFFLLVIGKTFHLFGRLIRGTETIGSGELTSRIGIESEDELGELARSFNRMAEALERTTVSRDALAQEIAERRKVEKTLLQRTSTIELLQQVAMAANASSDMQRALTICLEKFCKAAGWPIGHVYIPASDEANEMIPTAIWYLDAPERFEVFRRIREGTPQEWGYGLAGTVLATGKPVWDSNLANDAHCPRSSLAAQFGIRTGLAFPVMLGNDVAAVLEFFSEDILAPDHALLALMKQIGNQLGRVLERERAARALKQSEDRFKSLSQAASQREARLRLLLEQMPAILWSTDESLRFTSSIGAGMIPLKLSPEQIVGRTVYEHLGQDRSQAQALEAHRGALAGEARAFEMKWRGREFAGHVEPFRENEGYISGTIGVALDVTDRKLSEENLKRVANELSRSNRELEQFAYVASHDLQEPLRMIASYIDLLARRYQGNLDQDADEFIGYAVDGAKRMKKQIDDLLAYSRVNRQGTEFRTVKCTSVMARVLANLRLAIEESHADIQFNGLPDVVADAVQLGQLFQNLISNAIKFRKEIPPQIAVTALRRTEDWLFTISDNGIGLDMKYSERIFHIFQRLHTTAEYPGTGIGLAICKKIVERHGGNIWVESQRGKGSVFYFTLPGQPDLGFMN